MTKNKRMAKIGGRLPLAPIVPVKRSKRDTSKNNKKTEKGCSTSLKNQLKSSSETSSKKNITKNNTSTEESQKSTEESKKSTEDKKKTTDEDKKRTTDEDKKRTTDEDKILTTEEDKIQTNEEDNEKTEDNKKSEGKNVKVNNKKSEENCTEENNKTEGKNTNSEKIKEIDEKDKDVDANDLESIRDSKNYKRSNQNNEYIQVVIPSCSNQQPRSLIDTDVIREINALGLKKQPLYFINKPSGFPVQTKAKSNIRIIDNVMIHPPRPPRSEKINKIDQYKVGDEYSDISSDESSVSKNDTANDVRKTFQHPMRQVSTADLSKEAHENNIVFLQLEKLKKGSRVVKIHDRNESDDVVMNPPRPPRFEKMNYYDNSNKSKAPYEYSDVSSNESNRSVNDTANNGVRKSSQRPMRQVSTADLSKEAHENNIVFLQLEKLKKRSRIMKFQNRRLKEELKLKSFELDRTKLELRRKENLLYNTNIKF